ncbi:netrin-4-like isoform X2 [Morone saxatilis]|uniref:netrin-4-like isoform X2 n=1 Tax=Morone saxatilis TaxID=34816 RepID=UPI0015E239E8|nr:netrin-4-like isoform X2 [Morone saxatilis]
MSFSMRLFALLFIIPLCASSPLSAGPAAESRCFGRACNPRIGNLAQGRVLSTQSVCGSNSSEPYCFYKQTAAPRIRESCSAAKCGKCNAAFPSQAHPPSAMSDSSFRYPDTWWQSAEGVKEETLQLDLETEFILTHLILVFRSPRPAAMVLERSQDHGRTWKTLRYFARDCEEVFGLVEGSPGGESGATCTSKYSGAFPCARGEVIYRALSPWQSVDPYGPAAQEQLMITNLRVRLLQRQSCPCQAKHPGADVLPTDHYAIYDFIVKGSCLCNGHSDHCIPARGYQPRQQKTSNMVHGKCVCRHNTAGDHCERCAPLYNDQPWQAANGIIGTPNECQTCSCHPVGSVLSGGSTLCNPSSGECTCKPGVGGPRCDSCMQAYWGLHEYGCRPCDCTGDCDPYTGDCISGSDVEVFYTATGHMGHSSNNSETALFRVEELFSALHHSEKCECVEVTLGSTKLFCAAEYDYVLVLKVMSAHDKGSHAEVEVKVKKVLHQNPHMKIQRGNVTLYPESWTTQGCTCPILNPGSEYVVAGHEDWKTGQLMVNTKSLVKPWKSTLGRKLLHILRKDCGHW